jgi:UDP-glucose 4-epimerase
MTVLVTGGCGVMGPYLVRRLVAEGQRVVVLDRTDDRSTLGSVGDEVELVVGDVTNGPQLGELIESRGIDRVAHLASVLDDEAEADVLLGTRVNVLGTITVLDEARKAGIGRVVCLSSKDALGLLNPPYTHPAYEPVGTDLPPVPFGVYGETKWCAERLAECYSATTGLSVAMLRLSATYGPGKGTRHAQTGLVSRLIAAAIEGVHVNVAVGGDQRADLVYFGDVAQAVWRALTADFDGYRMIQIGSGQLLSLYEVMDVIKQVIPSADASIGPGLDYGGRGVGNYYRFDISPAYRQIGYVPAYDFKAGCEDFLRQVRGSGLSVSYADMIGQQGPS